MIKFAENETSFDLTGIMINKKLNYTYRTKRFAFGKAIHNRNMFIVSFLYNVFCKIISTKEITKHD